MSYGPGDVRGRAQHAEVRPAGRRRETTERAPRRYLVLLLKQVSKGPSPLKSPCRQEQMVIKMPV